MSAAASRAKGSTTPCACSPNRSRRRYTRHLKTRSRNVFDRNLRVTKRSSEMAIYLDHTIVPAHDKEKSAKFIAGIMGLEYNGLFGHFAPVKVHEQPSLDFDSREN